MGARSASFRYQRPGTGRCKARSSSYSNLRHASQPAAAGKGWERIYENEFKLRRVLYDTGLGNQRGAVEEFLDQLYGGRDGMTVVMLEFGRQEAANLARKEMAALGVPEPGRPRALTCQVSPAARG